MGVVTNKPQQLKTVLWAGQMNKFVPSLSQNFKLFMLINYSLFSLPFFSLHCWLWQSLCCSEGQKWKKNNCGRHVNPKLNSWWRLAGAGLHVTLQKVLEGSNAQTNPGNNRSEACVQPHSMGGAAQQRSHFLAPSYHKLMHLFTSRATH